MSDVRRACVITAGVLVAALLMLPSSASAHPPLCPETWNPAMQPQQWTAVPGGWTTAPGTNPNGPMNSDGFFLVQGGDEATHHVAIFGGCPDTEAGIPVGPFIDFFAVPLTVKYTEANGRTPGYQEMAGGSPQSDYIDFHIWGPDDMYVCVAGNSNGGLAVEPELCTCCYVPPPPF